MKVDCINGVIANFTPTYIDKVTVWYRL